MLPRSSHPFIPGAYCIELFASLPRIPPWVVHCIMAQPSFSVHRSSTGHDILPAAESLGTNKASFVSMHTLFVWTFGSGAVVRGVIVPRRCLILFGQ